MATTLIGWRPSALAVVCPSIVSAHDTVLTAQVHALGLPAASTGVRTEPTFAGVERTAAELLGAERLGTVKINNYIGTPAAVPAMGLAVAGATTSSVIGMANSELPNMQRGNDKVKGADARGIPPRGRRKV